MSSRQDATVMPMVAMLLPFPLRPHILVVDDDDRLRELLRLFLSENGFVVSTASGARQARDLFDVLAYDLVILDIMMPGESGLDLARNLRQAPSPSLREIPILFLTARAEAEERIEGLEAGGDDYLTKPFEPRELLLRAHAILRRARKEDRTLLPLRLGRWLYDPERDELRDGDEVVRLTDMEAGLMRALAADPGAVISREKLAELSKGEVGDRTIDVQVTRLRRKIEPDARNPRYLITMRGQGYCLTPDAWTQGESTP